MIDLTTWWHKSQSRLDLCVLSVYHTGKRLNLPGLFKVVLGVICFPAVCPFTWQGSSSRYPQKLLISIRSKTVKDRQIETLPLCMSPFWCLRETFVCVLGFAGNRNGGHGLVTVRRFVVVSAQSVSWEGFFHTTDMSWGMKRCVVVGIPGKMLYPRRAGRRARLHRPATRDPQSPAPDTSDKFSLCQTRWRRTLRRICVCSGAWPVLWPSRGRLGRCRR